MNDQKKWTIIQNTHALHYYPFKHIDHTVLAAIEDAMRQRQFVKHQRQISLIALKLFECFLQVTGNRLYLLDLSHPKFNKTVEAFVGALWSHLFISASIFRSYNLTIIFQNVLKALQAVIPSIIIPKIYFVSRYITDDIAHCIKQFKLISLIDDRVYYWHGWWTYNKNNNSWFVPLHGIYEHYGHAFTERIFNRINIFYSCGNAQSVTSISDFCRWLPLSGYTITQFDNATEIQNMFQDFLIYYMTAGYKKGQGQSIKYLLKNWKSFITIVEKYFLDNIFAEPYGKLIAPESARIRGSETRIMTTDDGIEIKEKLMTDIPLHTTDEQTIELLFKQIQSDYDHVVTIAEQQVNDLWKRFQRRKFLANKGIVRSVNITNRKDASYWIVNKDNPEWLQNICATFEAHGFALSGNQQTPLVYSYLKKMGDIAFALGLPSSYALLPYMVLLVSEHPKIVASFLTQFELYNKQGKQTGFIELDGVWMLDGRKPRRGATNAQQIIPLTAKSKALVEQIIAITDCARQHLKMEGNDSWRYLFVISGQGFTPRRMGKQYAKAKESTGTFYQALSLPTQDITKEYAEKLSTRFTLGTLRASTGILVYLKTRSVTAMAEALGHKNYSAALLSHYLPETILDFFQSRWIRIFQQGIIVEAMKDSPFLLEATKFSNMSEFHYFMKNHALKTIPVHLENKESTIDKPTLEFSDEVIFSINTGILTMLLSLRQAVITAQKRVCGKAAYWSDVTEHLVAHIENSSKHVSGDDFRFYLEEAKRQVNTAKMEKIIYG